MAALPVKEAQCKQMFSSCGVGRERVGIGSEPFNPASTLFRGLGPPPHLPPRPNSHVVCEGDVGTPCQQHADHLDVFMLCGPDDGCPSPTVLWWRGREVWGQPQPWPSSQPWSLKQHVVKGMH